MTDSGDQISAIAPEEGATLEQILSIRPSADRMERIRQVLTIEVPGVSDEIRDYLLQEDIKLLSVIYNQILGGVEITEELVDSLLLNSIDTHVHGGSDPFERLMPEDLIARDFTDAGCRAMVVKTWFTPSASRNLIVQRLTNEYAEAEGLRPTIVFGGITLNYAVGGFNPDAVKKALGFPNMKYVWFPMVDSYNHRRLVYDDWSGYGLKYTDDHFRIIPEVKEILRIIADNDLVLATGHYGYEDTAALIEEARNLGVERIEVIHPQLVHSGRHSIEQMRAHAERGAKLMLMGKGLIGFPAYNPPYFAVEAIKTIGAQHFVYGSDLGQVQNIPHLVGNRWAIKTLLANGLSVQDVKTVFVDSPTQLLGLEPASEDVPYKPHSGFGSPHVPSKQVRTSGATENCC